MRMCVGCREMREKRSLLRIVKSAEGEISFDPVGKKPGRGAYICRDRACLERAVRQKQLERAGISAAVVKAPQGLNTSGCGYAVSVYRHFDEAYALFAQVFFLGGFLFHILWETKSMYVLCYCVCLVPVAAQSAMMLGALLAARREKKAAPAA